MRAVHSSNKTPVRQKQGYQNTLSPWHSMRRYLRVNARFTTAEATSANDESKEVLMPALK